MNEIPGIQPDKDIEDLIREGLRPGDPYRDSEGEVRLYDSRDFFVGGDEPDGLRDDTSGGYGEVQ